MYRAWIILKPPPPHPSLWKHSLPRNRSLVPKRLGTAALDDKNSILYNMINAIFDGHLDNIHTSFFPRQTSSCKGGLNAYPVKFISLLPLFCSLLSRRNKTQNVKREFFGNSKVLLCAPGEQAQLSTTHLTPRALRHQALSTPTF